VVVCLLVCICVGLCERRDEKKGMSLVNFLFAMDRSTTTVDRTSIPVGCSDVQAWISFYMYVNVVIYVCKCCDIFSLNFFKQRMLLF
jgi:hypothetical protein